MKRALCGLLFVLAACGVETAAGSDTDHVLTVDGVQYDSYQESGDSIHWLTPGGDVESASFAERSQTWDGNGSANLPCDGQVHWVSTPNVLTISDCVSTSTTTTSTTSTTIAAPPPPPPTSSTTTTSSTSTSTSSTSSTSTSTTLVASPPAPPTPRASTTSTTVAKALPITK